MLRSSIDMLGYTIMARDGEIGQISDIYFDGTTWDIRYVVADVGKWVKQLKKVLLSPVVIKQPDASSLPVDLDREEIRRSPDIDTEKPVSRQEEEQLHQYFGWPLYWNAGPYMGPMPLPVAPSMEKDGMTTEGTLEKTDNGNDKPESNLRSTRKVRGYSMRADQEEIGSVDDFILETISWKIRYLVISVGSWFPSQKVLIAPEWINTISWAESQCETAISPEVIKNCPAYDPATPIHREYEEILYDYYGRPKYWS